MAQELGRAEEETPAATEDAVRAGRQEGSEVVCEAADSTGQSGQSNTEGTLACGILKDRQSCRQGDQEPTQWARILSHD